MFPQLSRFTALGLLLLRLMIGLVFVTSGYSHLKDPTGRAKSIGMSKAFTIFLGIAEVAGSLGVAFWSSHPACCLRSDPDHVRRHSEKDFHLAGFWGENGSGWHYDLMFVLINPAVAFTNGGS